MRMVNQKLSHRFRFAEAMTLIELLIVIAIISIFAGLLFPAFGRVWITLDRAKCTSNLRQVGAAMSSYVADHNGYLPGPVWIQQNPWYRANDYGVLGTVLAQYFGFTPPPGQFPLRADVLLCPAWKRGSPYQPGPREGQDEQFIMNWAVGPPTAQVNPWGDANIVFANNNKFGLDPAGKDRPKPIASIDNPSTTWAMQDLDQRLVFKLKPPPNPRDGGIAPTPVHGYHGNPDRDNSSWARNNLYFDFHVAAVPDSTIPLPP
jgi:prepilin-type N-terminal cleavage/methylation domain-containing protein